MQRKFAHVAMIMRAQQECRKRKYRAFIHPASYCSIIIDGPDQSAFGFLHFVTRSKPFPNVYHFGVFILEHRARKMYLRFGKHGGYDTA